MARFIHPDRDQMLMLPVNMEQLVDENHLARNIWRILKELDLSQFENDYQNDQRGALAFCPINLIAIIIYAYSTGIRSCREMERRCQEDLAYMYLAEMQTPDHTTLSNFRCQHDTAIEDIFSQTVFMGVESELIDFDHIANDGSKIKGAGSRNQIIPGEKLESKIEKCEKLVRKIMEEGRNADRMDEKASLQKKEARIKRTMEKLGQAKELFEKAKCGDKKKDKKLRYHLTEDDARLIKDGQGFISGYNCQASVDSKSQMVLDCRVVQDENDSQQGVVVRDRLIERFGIERLSGATLSFDNGYQNKKLCVLDGKDDIEILVSQAQEGDQISQEKKTTKHYHYDQTKDEFTCQANRKLTYNRLREFPDGRIYRAYRTNGCTNCAENKNCFKETAKNKRFKEILVKEEDLDCTESYYKYREKMNDPAVKMRYKKRMATVEPVFGHITSHRKADRFMVWGKVKANTEFTLMCLVHNVLKLARYSNIVGVAA